MVRRVGRNTSARMLPEQFCKAAMQTIRGHSQLTSISQLEERVKNTLAADGSSTLGVVVPIVANRLEGVLRIILLDHQLVDPDHHSGVAFASKFRGQVLLVLQQLLGMHGGKVYVIERVKYTSMVPKLIALTKLGVCVQLWIALQP